MLLIYTVHVWASHVSRWLMNWFRFPVCFRCYWKFTVADCKTRCCEVQTRSDKRFYLASDRDESGSHSSQKHAKALFVSWSVSMCIYIYIIYIYIIYIYIYIIYIYIHNIYIHNIYIYIIYIYILNMRSEHAPVHVLSHIHLMICTMMRPSQIYVYIRTSTSTMTNTMTIPITCIQYNHMYITTV